jgi:hypothetical protein
MAVDLKIPRTTTIMLKCKITEETHELLDQYVEAAKETNPNAGKGQVIEALLLQQMQRDNAFKRWCKDQQAGAGIVPNP